MRLPARLLALCLLGPSLVAAARGGAVQDSMTQRMQACVVCHGEEGRATREGYHPRIAGKPAGYLFEQLRNFREGRRHNAAMNHLMQRMSDDYLREIARYFAELDLPYPPPQRLALSEAQQRAARRLVFEGAPERQLPACVSCHGTAMAGRLPAMPGLLSLPADYLIGQLGAWRSGQRRASPPDCMADVARRLSDEEVGSLARWLSAQTLPQGTRPQAQATQPLPLRCGSGEAPVDAALPAVAAPPERIARGAYLARAGNCIGCHTARGGAPLAGGRRIETPFGAVVSSNLTPDARTGLGLWSADAFWRAMHHGRSRDGRLLNPAFPYASFTVLTREDSDDLYAYLRSVPAVERANEPHALSFPFGTQPALAVWRALFFRPRAFVPEPQQDARWNRGKYLVQGLGHCAACHSPRNLLGGIDAGDELGGGLMPGAGWFAPSLATPREAGVQGWDPARVVALLRDGVSAGASVSGSMADVVFDSTQHLGADDLLAMARYLTTIPRREPGPRHEAPGRALPPQELQAMRERGRALYADRCAACHGEDGRGAPGIYPALAGNRAVTLARPDNLVQIIRHGGFAPSTAGNPRPFGMPPFGQLLGDADIAAVTTFIRGAWGNAASPVSVLQVLRLR
ncbi:hypothetical protein MASR1M6_22960 [Rubrivivax sp.]